MAASFCSALLPSQIKGQIKMAGITQRKGNWALPWLCLQTFRSASAVVSAARRPGLLQVCAVRAVQTPPCFGFLVHVLAFPALPHQLFQ